MKIRAKDIAQMLGISPSAVSLAINNRPGVSEETRMRVKAKLGELGYHNMYKNETPSAEKSVDFVIYKRHGQIIMESPFYSLLIENIDLSVRKQGYKLMIQHIDKMSMSQGDIERCLSMSNSKGIIIFATEMKEDDFAPFFATGKPFVIVDNCFRDMNINSVAIDNRCGTYQAVSYLVGMGHRKIGYLKSRVEINSFNERFESFFMALRKHDIPDMSAYVFEVGYPETNTYADMRKILLSGRALPTAFFADNDLIAYGACRALKEFGYDVPGDVSLVGFDNRPICTLMEPTLTTVNVPKDLFGSRAVDVLMANIQAQEREGEEQQSIKIEIGTTIIERESVNKLDDINA